RVRDWFQSDFYGSCSDGCSDPLNTNSESGYRAIRGGSWFDGGGGALDLRVVSRFPGGEGRAPGLGFRCRRSP
ncbi:hypothetical protein ACFL51_01920, partial [Myxococcota bacterium]